MTLFSVENYKERGLPDKRCFICFWKGHSGVYVSPRGLCFAEFCSLFCGKFSSPFTMEKDFWDPLFHQSKLKSRVARGMREIQRCNLHETGTLLFWNETLFLLDILKYVYLKEKDFTVSQVKSNHREFGDFGILRDTCVIEKKNSFPAYCQ